MELIRLALAAFINEIGVANKEDWGPAKGKMDFSEDRKGAAYGKHRAWWRVQIKS